MLDDRDYMRPQPEYRPRTRGLPATIILIIITVVVHVFKEFTNGFQFLGCNIQTNEGTIGLALTLFKDIPVTAELPLFWQVVGVVSYIFMHANNSHLFWNMFGTYVFGSHLEQVLGKRNFIRLYLGSGVIAGVIWLIFTFDPGILVGASGSLFGVLIAAAMITPNMTILLFFIIPMRLKWFATGYLILTVFWLQGESRISHLAHLGGAIGGILITLLLHRNKVKWVPLGGLFMNRKPGGKPYKKPDLHVVNDDPLDSKTLDDILDKIASHGMKSLTDKEKRLLEQARRRLRNYDK